MGFKKKAAVSAATLAILAGALLGGIKYLQNQSPRQIVKTEGKQPVAVEELSYFNGKDKIFGKIYKPADSLGRHPAVVFCHGLAVNGDFGDAFCREAAGMGYVAYTFDFRGGSEDSRSTGDMTRMSILTQKADLETVLHRLRGEKFVDGNRIYLIGHSQGGLVASEAATEKHNGIAGMILLAPAFNIPDDGRARYPRLSDIRDTTYFGICTLGRLYYSDIHNLNPYKWLKKFKGDVLILQGTADTAVPQAYSEQAAEKFKNSTLEILEGGDHNFSGAYRKQALSLIRDYLKGQLEKE